MNLSATMNSRTLFVAFSSLFLFSQFTEAQAPSELLDILRRNFAHTSSLRAEMHIEKVSEAPYRDVEPGIDLSLPTKWTFSYWEKNDAFNYELNSQTKGKKGFIARQTRNGDFSQYLRSLDGKLLLDVSHKPMSSYWLAENATLMPYGFLFESCSLLWGETCLY